MLEILKSPKYSHISEFIGSAGNSIGGVLSQTPIAAAVAATSNHNAQAIGGVGSDVNNSNDINSILNDTESDVSDAHVDAPNDVLYMVCGVFIAMLFVGLIIVLVAVTINKLRKREESSVSPVSVEAQQVHHNNHHNLNHHSNNHNHHQDHHLQQAPVAFRQTPSSVWVFPPLPPQPNLCYANSQDALVQSDKASLKSLKKQLGGRFKRLVTKKHDATPVIPPELKPQLKTLYVY